MLFNLSKNLEAKIETLDESPVYLYEKEKIREVCRQFMNISYKPLDIHFALMANDNEEFLSLIKSEGIKVFVNSRPHLDKVLALGFPPADIIFTASATNKQTMMSIHESGAVVNLDSLLQVRQWKELFPKSGFGIRCNIGGLVESRKTRGGYFLGKDSRLGLDPEQIKKLSNDPFVKGLHLYVGTDILDLNYFKDCYTALKSFVPLFPALEYIDLGGGFGVPEEQGDSAFDFEAYSNLLNNVFSGLKNSNGTVIRLVLEPGRIIGCEAGYFVCTVTDIKEAEHQRLLGTDASAVQFPRPLFYPDDALHPVVIPGARPVDYTFKTSVYGCSTYSRDFLGKDLLLPEVKIGQKLVFGNAGSYCASSFTSFLGFDKPKELFLD